VWHKCSESLDRIVGEGASVRGRQSSESYDDIESQLIETTRKADGVRGAVSAGHFMHSVMSAATADEKLLARVNLTMMEIDADAVSVFAYNAVTQMMDCLISPDIKGQQLDPSEGFLGETFQTGNTFNIADVTSDSRHSRAVGDAKVKVKSLLSAAILNDNGEPIGVVQAMNKGGGGAFTAKDEAALVLLSCELSCIVDELSMQMHQVVAHKGTRALESVPEEDDVLEHMETFFGVNPALIGSNSPSLLAILSKSDHGNLSTNLPSQIHPLPSANPLPQPLVTLSNRLSNRLQKT